MSAVGEVHQLALPARCCHRQLSTAWNLDKARLCSLQGLFGATKLNLSPSHPTKSCDE